MGEEIGFDLRLVLAAGWLPAPVVGAGTSLGRTAWLAGGGARDRDDLVASMDERRAA